MSVVPKIDLLPKKIRAEFDRKLIEQGFGGYQKLSDWLKEQGYSIGTSAIGEYAKELRQDINKLRVSHNFATAYGYELPDDDGTVIRMLNGLTKDILYRVLARVHTLALDLDKDDDLGNVVTVLKLLEATTKSLSVVTRSDVAEIAIAKHAADVRAKQEAALNELGESKTGITQEFLDEVRTKILRI
ncbi:MAG: phage protein Gp27 family protein [Chroococcidiopsis sp.]